MVVPRHRNRRRNVLIAGLIVVLVAGGMGAYLALGRGLAPNGAAHDTPAGVVQLAAAAMKNVSGYRVAGSVNIAGTPASSSYSFTFNYSVHGSEIDGTVTMDGSTLHLVKTGGSLYIDAPASFSTVWTQAGVSAASVSHYAGKWIDYPWSGESSFTNGLAPSDIVAGLRNPGSLAHQGTGTVAGQGVVLVRGSDAGGTSQVITYAVATSGRAYVLQEKGEESGSSTHWTWTFSDWNAVAAISPPTAAVTLPSAVASPAPSSSVSNSLSFNESTVSWLAANVNDTGTPPSTPTGTLTLAGSTDVSGMLDPQGEYDTIGYTVLLTMDRTLVGYAPSSDFNTATSVVDDAASSYTVSNGGKTYKFTLRSGLRWAVTDPTTGAPVAPDDGTPVTSQDFALGLERECDPTLSAYANPSYYTSTIAGYATFCNGFEALLGTATPAQRAAYISANPISGISTPNSQTLVITLTSPAVDFPNIMSMFFAAAAPPASLNYTPLTAGNPIWSDGPYEVQSYVPGQTIVLVPNPYWGTTTGTNTTATSWSLDPNRHRYVAEISIDETLGADAAADEVQQEIQADTLDLEWNNTVPLSSLAGLANYSNPLFGTFPAPGITNPYLVFNLQASSPLQNVKVRQALEYAVNKVALAKIYGGADFNTVLNQVFGPGAQGYIAGYNPYPTPNNEGDPTTCKSLLTAAGYPNGFTITDAYRTDGSNAVVFQEIQSDFAACGVTVNGTGISQGYYTSSGILADSAGQLANSGWDMTQPGWVPDWYGSASARSILPDLFGSSDFPGTNWGDFSNSNVDNLISEAESASTLAQATTYWQDANEAVMEQAPFIPVMGQLTNLMHSSSVHNALYNPFSAQYNLDEIWLS